MLEKAWSHFGLIDYLVNNAGVSVLGILLTIALALVNVNMSDRACFDMILFRVN